MNIAHNKEKKSTRKGISYKISRQRNNNNNNTVVFDTPTKRAKTLFLISQLASKYV